MWSARVCTYAHLARSPRRRTITTRNLFALVLSLLTVLVLVLMVGYRPSRSLDDGRAVTYAPPALPEPARFSVRGRVTDPAGRPVAGALVQVGSHAAISGPAGEYRIDGLVTANPTLYVSANRYREQTLPFVVEGDAANVDAILQTAGPSRLRLRLVDAATDRVPADAVARLYDLRTLEPSGNATAADDGSVAFPAVPAGEYLVTYGHEGGPFNVAVLTVPHREQRLILPATGPTVAAAALATVHVEGVVRSATSRAITPGVGRSVWVTATDPLTRELRILPVGDDGRFTAELPEGTALVATVVEQPSNSVARSPARPAAGGAIALVPGPPFLAALPLAGVSAAAQPPAERSGCGPAAIGVVADRDLPEGLVLESLVAGSIAASGGSAFAPDVVVAGASVLPAYLLVTHLAPDVAGHPVAYRLSLFEPATGGVLLSRAGPLNSEAPGWQSTVDLFVDQAMRLVREREEPASALLDVQALSHGAARVDVRAIRNAAGDLVPDGTLVALSVDGGTLTGPGARRRDGLLLFPVLRGAVEAIHFDPYGADPIPGGEPVVRLRAACGPDPGTLDGSPWRSLDGAGDEIAARSIAAPWPRSMRYHATFEKPSSTATCGAATGFTASIQFQFSRLDDQVLINIPVVDGPVLRGTFDSRDRSFWAWGETPGTHWQLAGIFPEADGAAFTAALAVDVEGGECPRRDTFPIDGTLVPLGPGG